MPIPVDDGTTELFTAADLASLLQCEVGEDTAVTLEQVVWGWLRGPLRMVVRPIPIPAEVFSWAVELGAIAHENPAGLAAYQLGEERTQYSAERRNEILAAAANGGRAAGAPPPPRGAFPPVPCYPDPVGRYPMGRARW